MNEKFSLAFVLYKDKNIMTQEISRYYEKLWGEPLNVQVGTTQLTGTIQQFSYVISFVDEPINREEMERVASHNPFFQEGLTIAKKHMCHAVVGVKGVGSSVARYKVLTKLLAAMLSPYNAVAVYLGEQSLYYGKEQLLTQAKLINQGRLPVDCWIYFGFYTYNQKFWVYTNGLNAFGRDEIEIASDCHTMQHLHQLALVFSHALMSSHRQFEDGEMIEIMDDYVSVHLRYSETLKKDVYYLEIEGN